MRALVPLAIAVLVALAPAASAAVDFAKDYSDPASDVMRLDANGDPVVVDGKFVMSPNPSGVNILRLRSTDAGQNVTLRLELKGAVLDQDNATYTISLYTDATNRTRRVVEYRNGTLNLWVNTTPGQKTDFSGNSTITNAGPGGTAHALEITVAKSLLGTIDAWDIDATAMLVGTPYSYRDFGWALPGNPGSGPTNPEGGGLLSGSNLWWLLLAVAILAGIVVLVLVTRRKKRDPTAPTRPKS